MSKLTDQLREIRIFNDHGFFNDGGTQVYISYSPAERGRAYKSACWQVHRFVNGREVQTDPDGHWRDYGRKTFSAYRREDKAPALERAQAWCAERYGITEWARSPFGGYGDAEFVKARLKELKGRL